ncbi:unnamed protein product [Scytosiphon promiscuus]
MYNLEIKNFDEECVHLRYFVTFTEITGCTIQHCGKHSFEDGGGGKVGEAIYVGTALDQVKDGKTPEVKLRTGSADKPDADVCQYNWIHKNTLRTHGNECVDIKEGSINNLVEYNICEEQNDENSGGIGCRSNDNTIRWNKIAEVVGAGIRIGGDQDYGVDNNIYGNVIKNADYGAFNLMSEPQGMFCGNSVSGVDVVLQGAEKGSYSTDEILGSCSGNDTPGDIPGFNSEAPSDWFEDGTAQDSEDDDGAVTPLEQDTEDDTICAGVNCAGEDGEEETDAEEAEKIFEITTNSNEGESGLGECTTVVGVSKVKADHWDDRDDSTDPDAMFDGDLSTHFSVNRESTYHILELAEETEIHGISIGFFMKYESEERIQTFDVSVRANDESDYTTVISRKESSGEMGVIEHFEFTSPVKAQYVKVESHGNTFNNWTAFTEIEVCGTGAETNALFGGVSAAKNELAKLAGEVCADPFLLPPVKSKATGSGNVKDIFDGNFETRWSTTVTQASNDLDNAKIILTFRGDVKISYVKIAFYDGDLAKPHFGLYKQSAKDDEWTEIAAGMIGGKQETFQTFELQETGVNKLYIVGNGNDVGFYTKVSEVEVYGC